MIENIHVSNYALIDHTELALKEGFTVITGETGAGKSILLGAIAMTLGQRADSSIIQDKSRKCVIEITYRIENYDLQHWFEENDLDYAETVIVLREITAEGKSRCFINDTPVSNKLLKEYGTFMVDIHSQHQSLLVGKPEYQTEILDAFCGHQEELDNYQKLYGEYNKLLRRLEHLKSQEADLEKEGDYLRFRFNQLEKAQLKIGEKEELEQELNLLTHAERIKSALMNTTWCLRDMEQPVVEMLKGVRNNLSGVEEVMPEIVDFRERLDSVLIELGDIADGAERKAESIEYTPQRIEEIHLRLNTLYDLLYKYKVNSIEELVNKREELERALQHLAGNQEEIEGLEKRLVQLTKQMKSCAEKLHEARVVGQEKLCEEMKHLLLELGIRHAEFVVKLTALDYFTLHGSDEIQFLFSANKNQIPGEISKVASGGEISRVMLALKYILSTKKKLPVIVFDEIDSGLSGEVAHKMAQMMREMSNRMQVISISHLPQIAAAGNSHFKVYKEDSTDLTISRIRQLDVQERVQEIAAMLSGKEITPAAMEAAMNLLG